ncbi:MAG: efflux RND transporter periplasmic adaptor subunit [Selenomonadaceae bacterium]|nr:efflux RND transporter periplasmic adaptor subunit [Selenomonadaceae bacterium]MDD7056384.1 efflux RND transporter periplasmic adaptor subunit [Selenomonadaceae bacterium]MDY3915555.1 efflux RND transporter periplasmic adaptor subunit [Selenomonadaceae bacterium]
MVRHRLGNWSHQQKIMAVGILFILLCVGIYFAFASNKGVKVKVKHSRPLVKVVTLQRQDMMRHIDLSGQTVADANIPLAPKYTGRVREVCVQLGDHVQAGQVLLVQDTSDLDISIQQNAAATQAAEADTRTTSASYNASYVKARNDYELEASKYERNQYLFSIGAISQDTLDKVKQEYLASKASFDALADQVSGGDAASVESKRFTAEKQQHATEALEQQRDDLILRAPRDGVIGFRDIEAGAIAQANKEVLSLVDNSHLNVDCTLGENDAAVLSTGMEVSVTVDALGCAVPGRIVYVAPAMDSEGKTYQVRIELEDAAIPDSGDGMSGLDVPIKAGLYAHTTLDILQRRNTLFVPKEAVLSRNGKTSVWVVDSEGKVSERAVKIGLMNNESEEIIDGLAEGDVVILNNQDKLKEGSKVDIDTSDASDDSNAAQDGGAA